MAKCCIENDIFSLKNETFMILLCKRLRIYTIVL